MTTQTKRVVDIATMTGPGDGTPFMIKRSTNYDQFSFMRENRKVNRGHVERLKRSFQKSYLLSPILVNEFYQIIDGQHRFIAASELGVPVFYIIIQGYGIEEVQTLNTNSNNWTRKDFLHAYCEQKIPSYLLLRNFLRQFPDIGIQSALIFLTGKLHGHKYEGKNSTRSKDFEEGKLEISDTKKAEKYAKMLMDFKAFYPGFNRRVFVAAMYAIFNNENYNHKEMMKKLEMRAGSIKHCVNIQEYRILIEDIYNYRRTQKVNIRY